MYLRMKKNSIAIFMVAFILSLGLIFTIDQGSLLDKTEESQADVAEDLPEVNWKMLQDFDLKTGEGPEELMALDGKIVKMPGFVVPLSDDYSELGEFLLVPNAQACIHVPPPPANLIVTVKLREPVPADDSLNPAWVTGRFKIETTESQYGGSAYKIDAMKIEKYEY